VTDDRGVDCVVEIGGSGHDCDVSEGFGRGRACQPDRREPVAIGAGLDPLLLIGRGTTLGSISVGSPADFEAMNRAIAMRRLHPVMDQTFPLSEAKETYRHFEGRGHFGKVVMTHG